MGFITQIGQTIVAADLGSAKNETVAQVQSALQQLGLLPKSQEDGIFNAQTQSALSKFQGAKKLPVTGTINPETIDKLNKEIETRQKRQAIYDDSEPPSTPRRKQSLESKKGTTALRASTVQRELSSSISSSGEQKRSIPPSISMPPQPSSSPTSPQLITSDPESYTGSMPSLPAPPRPTSQLPIQRGRADAHGQRSLPEQAVDLKAQVDRSMVTEPGKKPFDKPIDRISRDMVSDKSSFDKYAKAAQKPLANPGPERVQQFEKLKEKMAPLTNDDKAGKFFSAEQKLLQDTMKDKVLMDSPHISSPAHAMELKRLGMQPSIAGRVGQFTDTQLKHEMKALGSGQFNTVWAGKYKMPDGPSFYGVFKSESTAPSQSKALVDTGIDRENPRTGYRNVATTRLDEALGFRGLTTRSEMAVHNSSLGTVSERAQGESAIVDGYRTGQRVPDDKVAFWKQEFGKQWLDEHNKANPGQKIEKVKGEYQYTSFAFRNIDYSDPQLRRDLVRLQLMDSIAGQADRHPGNYFVQLDEKGKYIGLKGIDNDLSWGKSFRTFDNSDGHLPPGQRESSIRLPQYLPPVIDSDAKKSILALNPKTFFQEKMGGLLTSEEMSAAADRLKLVQAHISDPAKCKVLDHIDDWKSDDVTIALTRRVKGQHTSYISREVEEKQKFKDMKLLVDYYDPQKLID